ncbi:hypothetical protein PoB_000951900 [Plakobranchus ocellatus]|uniref:Ig-like domain-containing protein n=1 Tax=Plakobranchus ocellatus TaxID=259542 RepID=A0AAV3YLJ7_9GAST|nr:hypothetical protein PoB_000951900 [Plakobranchus ocellatus]
MVQSDRVQDLHACVGTNAYIPWPLNIMTRRDHKATVITLTFQRRHSERKMMVASYSISQQLVATEPFKGRLTMSSEHSGAFLKRVGLHDDGLFTAQARSSKGRIWTRTTNLTVHVRPLVKGERLNVSKSEILSPDSGPASELHCVKLKCGFVDYAGYPPTHYIWQATSKVLAEETATDESVSMLELCGPFSDHVTCSIAGFSSTCTYDYVVSIFVDLPAPSTNTSQVASSGVSSDLILMVVVPLLAVGIPLVVLGVWVLSHLLGDRRRRRYNSVLRVCPEICRYPSIRGASPAIGASARRRAQKS